VGEPVDSSHGESVVIVTNRPPKWNFRQQAESAFRFLQDEYGYETPEYSESVVPALRYLGPVLSYQVAFDAVDAVASVIVRKAGSEGGNGYRASMRDVVPRSGQGTLPDVRVRKVEELARRLTELAHWVRILHPVLLTPDGDQLILTPDWPKRQ
jgi:hypothetical protein